MFRIAKVIEGKEPKFGRSILKLSEEETKTYQEQCLQSQIKKQNRRQKDLEEKVESSRKLLQKSMQKLHGLQRTEEEKEEENAYQSEPKKLKVSGAKGRQSKNFYKSELFFF